MDMLTPLKIFVSLKAGQRNLKQIRSIYTEKTTLEKHSNKELKLQSDKKSINYSDFPHCLKMIG